MLFRSWDFKGIVEPVDGRNDCCQIIPVGSQNNGLGWYRLELLVRSKLSLLSEGSVQRRKIVGRTWRLYLFAVLCLGIGVWFLMLDAERVLSFISNLLLENK